MSIETYTYSLWTSITPCSTDFFESEDESEFHRNLKNSVSGSFKFLMTFLIRKKYIPSYKKILERNASMTYQNRKFIKYLKTYSTDCERRESSKGKISSRIFGRKKKLPKPLIHFSVIFRRVFGSLAHSTSIQFLLISNSKDDFEKI